MLNTFNQMMDYAGLVAIRVNGCSSLPKGTILHIHTNSIIPMIDEYDVRYIVFNGSYPGNSRIQNIEFQWDVYGDLYGFIDGNRIIKDDTAEVVFLD